jgi:hypothetical protein
MAESTGFVNDFINDIKERLTPIARRELNALFELKRADTEAINPQMRPELESRELQLSITGTSAIIITSPKSRLILLMRRSSLNTFRWKSP